MTKFPSFDELFIRCWSTCFDFARIASGTYTVYFLNGDTTSSHKLNEHVCV
jgi:hypothetical protein